MRAVEPFEKLLVLALPNEPLDRLREEPAARYPIFLANASLNDGSSIEMTVFTCGIPFAPPFIPIV